jgi:hypothetical protein
MGQPSTSFDWFVIGGLWLTAAISVIVLALDRMKRNNQIKPPDDDSWVD